MVPKVDFVVKMWKSKIVGTISFCSSYFLSMACNRKDHFDCYAFVNYTIPPSVALDPSTIVSELIKFPKFLLSAVSIVTGLNITVNDLWACLNWNMIGVLSTVAPSTME